MPTSTLATVSFWRVLADKLGRQAAQTAAPILAAVVAAGGSIDVRTVTIGLAGTLLVTLVKGAVQYIADAQVTPGAPLPWQWLDRAAPAAAGVIAGLLPADWRGLIDLDWRAAAVAAGSAAALAVLALYVTPPAFTAGRTEDGAYVVTSLPDAPGGDR